MLKRKKIKRKKMVYNALMFKKSWVKGLVAIVITIVFAIIGYLVLHDSKAAVSADINNDGSVGIGDLTILAANYGLSGKTFGQGDITGDGLVNIYDFSILAAQWGNGTQTGVNKARPFAANSPFNTPTPTSTVWYDTPNLHVGPPLSNGDTFRHWYVSTDGLHIWWSSPTDPVWTFNMPNFIACGWNRNRPAQTFQIHAPSNISPGSGSDATLGVYDPVSGDYIEVWQASVNSSTHTVTSSPGPGWGTGNAITGTGVGTLCVNGNPPTGGINSGVRAANFAWGAGLITGADIAAGKIDHAIAIALPPDMLMDGVYTGYRNGGTSGEKAWRAPATAWENDKPGLDVRGPIEMGTKIGIPQSAPKPPLCADPTKSGPSCLSNIGSMVFDAARTYGIYVGDLTGGQWPIFYIDAGSVTGQQVDPLYAFWNYCNVVNGTNVCSADMEKIGPLLRVADYQPL